MSGHTSPARASLILIAVLAAGLLGACSKSGSGAGHSGPTAAPMTNSTAAGPTPVLASASVGPLVISGGYIPAPASPDVAAAYLTITNNGDTAVRLTKVTTSITSDVMAMKETGSGGVGTMTDLTRVVIPAHGRMRFVPDHAHLMLQNPKPLMAGDQVAMALTFTPAGTVHITLPVLPLNEAPTSTPTSMGMSSTPSSESTSTGRGAGPW